MGGHQVPGRGSGDDGYDEEGFDESQRAEILEATRNGPGDGTVMTNLDPDLGEMRDDDGASEDEVVMDSTTIGEMDDDASMDRDDIKEDDVQAELDDGSIGSDELTDRDDAAVS
ncbi:MAG: DNA primase [Sphingomonas bacterium]|nr:DNA primase [Sphingomonas bacterium]